MSYVFWDSLYILVMNTNTLHMSHIKSKYKGVIQGVTKTLDFEDGLETFDEHSNKI